MILQALYEYYQRKAQDPESNIAPEGWEWKEIPFLVVINGKGKFIHLEDTRESIGAVLKAKTFLVPRAIGRSGSRSYLLANSFWDHYGYVLGHSRTDKEEDKKMAARQLTTFRETFSKLPEATRDSTSVKAVASFYKIGEYSKVFGDSKWEDCKKITGCNLTFKLSDSMTPVTETEEVKAYINSRIVESDADENSLTDDEQKHPDAVCLITGEKGRIARKHSRTPIDKDTKALVSFQKNSGYDSYGKSQAFNAPVSISAEFAYTTALNHLLRKESVNKLRVGNTTLVFWAEKGTKAYDLETDLPWFFSDPPKDDPDRGVRAVKSLFTATQSGKLPANDSSRFYVLGLSPNSARIAVRLWKVGTVRDFAERIKLHFDDLEIVKGPKDSEYLSLNQLLKATVLQYKSDNIPPNLAGAVVASVLDGTPYPRTLFQQCIRRIRAERHVTHARAAILKAYINRSNRFYGKIKKEEIGMALDPKNVSPGYRLGRLFAVLDRIQEEASPGINATIRDRFYGAASSSPVSVFSQLLKLKNHHLGKLGQKRRDYMEKAIGEIMSELNDFPPHLTMEEQARFAVGYYHQRQSFFEKRDQEVKEETK